MPLEGEEEGVGNFLGNICSQYFLGTLDASDATVNATRVIIAKSKHLCILHEDDDMFESDQRNGQSHPFGWRGALEGMWKQTC